MSDWDEFFQNQFNHNCYHQENPYLSSATIFTRFPDLSCPICFPDWHTFEYTWIHFRTWFSALYSVDSYTKYSRRCWDVLQVNTHPLGDITYINAIRALVRTFRYNRIPPLIDHLVQDVHDEFTVTERFRYHPDNNLHEDSQTRGNRSSSSSSADVDEPVSPTASAAVDSDNHR